MQTMMLQGQFIFIHMKLLSLSTRWRVQAAQMSNFRFHHQQHPLNHHILMLMHTLHHKQTLRKAHHHLITIQHLIPTHTIHRQRTTRHTRCRVMQVNLSLITACQHLTTHRRHMGRPMRRMDHQLHPMDRQCQQ